MATAARSDRSASPAATPAATMIELRAATRRFASTRDVVALDAVSLAIPRGEMVAVIGPSGSGKSTLLNLVGGLDRPTSGDVSVDGELFAGLSDDELTRVRRDKIGFIFQFFNLLPTLTCLENVGLPLHLRGWPRRKVDERARELLNLVQLGHRLTHLPEELSGGERQRVAIARALAAHPAVLVCDEVTSALDVSVQAAVLDLLDGLRRSLGLAILFITHDLGVVAAIADDVVVLEHGEVRERGPAGRVLTRPEDGYTQALVDAAPRLPKAI